MVNVGRYLCVALPFILTVASIIAFLVAGLTGVTDTKGLYIFRIDITQLKIDGTQIQDIVGNVTDLLNGDLSNITPREPSPAPVQWHESSLLSEHPTTAETSEKINDIDSVLAKAEITAADLGLANLYDFTLWGYCVTQQDGAQNCTKAKFDWARDELNLTWVDTLSQLAGVNVTLPQEVTDGLNLFKEVSKWSQVVWIIAIVALGLELIVGLFTACSRAVSCLTWILSGVATAAAIASAALITSMAAVVVGTVESVASQYEGHANFNNSYLATIWLGVAFALGASLFWLFSICCCKPENRPYGKRSRHSDSETEKFIPSGSYAPLGDSHNRASAYNYGVPQRGGARSDLAYEPYAHSRV